MAASILGATLRDLSYIASRLRPEDAAEVAAQFDEWSPVGLAALSLRDHAYVVTVNGNPEAAFGAGQIRKGQFIAWSWGSRLIWRCVPSITRFVRSGMIPAIYASGGQRVEARALASNESAHRWLMRMGAKPLATLRNYGTAGEHFILFEWVRDDWRGELGRALGGNEEPDAVSSLRVVAGDAVSVHVRHVAAA